MRTATISFLVSLCWITSAEAQETIDVGALQNKDFKVVQKQLYDKEKIYVKLLSMQGLCHLMPSQSPPSWTLPMPTICLTRWLGNSQLVQAMGSKIQTISSWKDLPTD